MNQYFAVTSAEDMCSMKYLTHRNILISYFYWDTRIRDEYMEHRTRFGELFMDSGAFSFYNSKKTVNIDDYIETLKRDKIKKYSALDVIGDPKATLENFKIMKDAGLDPIPTFHINTDGEYLKYYLEHEKHLAIGGMVGAQNIVGNLDKIWRTIIQINPDIKVHGFGVTNADIALRYPWASIDGSSFNTIVKFSRAREWHGEGFKDMDTKILLQKMKYTLEGTNLGNLRHFLLYWQMEQYNRMIDFINEKHKTKDFSYLTAQQTLF